MYDEIKLNLQSFAKRVYDSILYQSTFYNFLNPNYIGTLRQTGAPVIEVAKTDALQVNVRNTKEINGELKSKTIKTTVGRIIFNEEVRKALV